MSKIQRLENMLTKTRKLTIAALDHRSSLMKNLHPENPELTTEREMFEWKKLMVGLYAPKVTCLIMDPVYGAKLVGGGGVSWMMSMEKAGFRGSRAERVTEVIDGWSVKAAKELGADSVKLLLYYDPENLELARRQKELANRIAKECEQEKIIFLLEPLAYNKTRDSYIVEKMVDDLREVAVDIWKLEYPGDRERCERISRKVKIPWVLLSAGADYATYKEQLRTACEAGASGMAVGRAAWQEFGQYEGEKREKFLREVAVARIEELVEIVEKYGKPVV